MSEPEIARRCRLTLPRERTEQAVIWKQHIQVTSTEAAAKTTYLAAFWVVVTCYVYGVNDDTTLGSSPC